MARVNRYSLVAAGACLCVAQQASAAGEKAGAENGPAGAAGRDGRPNIVVILADDLGFSDVGCYGSEIHTPNIDRLAAQGVKVTELYNSARSCPSRASLLTGLYPHQTGLGHMDGKTPAWPAGYSGFRSESDNVTIPEVMRAAGYYTAMSGKWHLGRNADPVKRGFEDFYGMLGGFGSFWDPSLYTREPAGSPTRDYPQGSFYSTNAITDYAIDFAGNALKQGKPLFLYLAYNAPHFPLHAPKEMIDKYMPTYLKGWDAIRAERFARMCKLGVLQGHPQMSPRGEVPQSMFVDQAHPIPAWNSLSTDQQTDLARRMAIFAAMVDIMDTNIGRFLDALRASGQLDNTLIIFTSDNGACAEWQEFGFDGATGLTYHTHVGAELDEMGLPGSYCHYGTGWANVGCTPFVLYKHFTHEGGISAPSVIWWGGHIARPGRTDFQPLHITDIMATCVDLGQAPYPATVDGRKILPMEGRSLRPVIENRKMPERTIFGEHEGNRMVREGDWKLVSTYYDHNRWELYDIRRDRTEQHDLATKYPEKIRILSAEYAAWAARCDVEPFAPMWNKYSTPAQYKFPIIYED